MDSLAKNLVQLIHEIENEYGSVINCPEDDRRLKQMQEMTKKREWSFDCPPEVATKEEITKVPSTAVVDDMMKEVHVVKDFKDVYDHALKTGLTLRRASTDLGYKEGHVQSIFYNGKSPERYQYIMEFDGHIIRGKNIKGVLSQARALGFHGNNDKAIRYYKLRREVKIAPVVFNYGKADEYIWKY